MVKFLEMLLVRRQGIYEIELYTGEKCFVVRGKMDTGNSLKDPCSQKPVHVMAKKKAEELFGEELRRENKNFYRIPYLSLIHICFVSATAYMLQMPLFILIVGLIYLVEVVSVMIQVTYFKKTGGKRFFKMAPIHHHFELCGWSETRVVAVFSIVTAILCLIAYMGL